MKVMVEGLGNNLHAVEIELAELLAPEVDDVSDYEGRRNVCHAIGKLGAMMVMKGICTIPEAQAACGVSHYKVVGRPVTERKGPH